MAPRFTDLEQRLVDRLREGGGHPVTRAALLRDVWNVPGSTSTRTVDMAISRLRRKLDDGSIASVGGQGYLLRGGEEPEPEVRVHLLDGWIEPSTGRVRRGDSEQRLTGRQRKLIALLAASPGRPVASDAVLRALDIAPHKAGSTLRALVFRLRRKLEVDPTAPNHLITAAGGSLVLVPAEGTHAGARHNLPVRETA